MQRILYYLHISIQYVCILYIIYAYAYIHSYTREMRVYTWRFARVREQRARASINNIDPMLFIAVIRAHVSREFTRFIYTRIIEEKT